MDTSGSNDKSVQSNARRMEETGGGVGRERHECPVLGRKAVLRKGSGGGGILSTTCMESPG